MWVVLIALDHAIIPVIKRRIALSCHALLELRLWCSAWLALGTGSWVRIIIMIGCLLGGTLESQRHGSDYPSYHIIYHITYHNIYHIILSYQHRWPERQYWSACPWPAKCICRPSSIIQVVMIAMNTRWCSVCAWERGQASDSLLMEKTENTTCK